MTARILARLPNAVAGQMHSLRAVALHGCEDCWRLNTLGVTGLVKVRRASCKSLQVRRREV